MSDPAPGRSGTPDPAKIFAACQVVLDHLRNPHQPAERFFRALRNHTIAEASKTVHPVGNPISHSTHLGFNCPPICSESGRLFLSIVAWLALPDFQSRLVGIGQRFNARWISVRFIPLDRRPEQGRGVGTTA